MSGYLIILPTKFIGFYSKMCDSLTIVCTKRNVKSVEFGKGYDHIPSLSPLMRTSNLKGVSSKPWVSLGVLISSGRACLIVKCGGKLRTFATQWRGNHSRGGVCRGNHSRGNPCRTPWLHSSFPQPRRRLQKG